MKTQSPLWHRVWLQLPVVWLLTSGWLSPLIGCKQLSGSQREPVLVFDLDDRAYDAPPGLQFDLHRAREMLEEAVGKSEKLELVEDRSPRVFRAELTINEASEQRPEKTGKNAENDVLRIVQVDLALNKWPDESQAQKLTSMGRSSQIQSVDGTERQEEFEKLLEQAIHRAVEYIDLQLLSRDLPLQELEKLLASELAEERFYVLRALRDRSDANLLVLKLIKMLSDPDPNVAMESVGVLVAQKNPRAVQPLIRMSRRRDQIFLLQIITALAEIRGAEARGYLFTLAAGHTSPIIRKRAKEALESLLRRQQELDQKDGLTIKTSAIPVADPKQLH